MSDIGRLDLARALRRALEISGSYEPSLGEGIVPTVQVLDLQDSPFGLSLPWVWGGSTAIVAGQHAYVFVTHAGPLNSLVTVHEVIVHALGAVEAAVHIVPYSNSEIPGGFPAPVPVRSARQGAIQTTARIHSEVAIFNGNSATAPVTTGLWARAAANTTVQVEGDWVLGANSSLAVVSQAVATNFAVSFRGRIHFTSNR